MTVPDRSVLRFRLIAPLLLLLLPVVVSCGVAQPSGEADGTEQKPLRIHMISGSEEYESETSLSSWKEKLEKHHSVRCTISFGTDGTETLEGLVHLPEADLLVLFNRRFELKDEYWKPIRAYLDSGRPVLGIRTASHAFDRNYPKIDRELLGADYHGHGSEETVKVKPVEEQRDHPILKGIGSWTRPGKLYRNNEFDSSTTILLRGLGKRLNEPVA